MYYAILLHKPSKNKIFIFILIIFDELIEYYYNLKYFTKNNSMIVKCTDSYINVFKFP